MRGQATVLAVVPARGGSKGIPRKNLAELGGVSLVRRAVALALSLSWIDMTVLSTDDEEIADECRKAGLSVPTLRPQELASDLASGYAVWRHALLDAEARTGRTFDLSVLLQPPSPFRTAKDVEACADLVVDGEFDSAVTVSPTPAHFTPEKTMTLTSSGTLQPYLPTEQFQPTRQLIPPYYHLNGICYAARREVIADHEHVFGDRTGAVVIDRWLVNIDDPYDLELARWLWERT